VDRFVPAVPHQHVVPEQVGRDAEPRVGLEFQVDEGRRRADQAKHLVRLSGHRQIGVEDFGGTGREADARGEGRHPIGRTGVDQTVQGRVERFCHNPIPPFAGARK
jgi:hypothetical protein